MQQFQTRSALFIQILQNRLESIQSIEKDCLTFNPTKEIYRSFYDEVAYFVHAVMNDPDAKKLYFSVLNYKKELHDNPNYQNAIQNINESVAAIAKALLDIPEIGKLDEGDNSYANYQANPVVMKATHLLKRWLTFDSSQTSEKDEFRENYLTSTVGVAGRMAENLLKFVAEERVEPVAKLIQELRYRIEWYDYFHEFEHGYRGVMAAEHLAKVYISIHPGLFTDFSVNQIVQVNMIKEGQGFLGTTTIRTLTGDCEKIFNYIKEKLYTQLSIEAYIEHFVTYISLYYTIDFEQGDAEKEMQTKFEEFLYNAGYYPISEMQLQYGRLDTIAVNQDFAFLFEHKQIDLNKTDENNVAEKLRNAQIQSHIYKDSLSNFPRLNHHVFILLFTNRKVVFKNNIDRMTRNGIVFIAKACTVYNDTASNIKEEVIIDIDELIK